MNTEAATTRLGGLDMGLRAHGDGAAAGLVRLADAVGTHDEGAGGEIGSGQDLHELRDRGVGVVDKVARRLDNLVEVMRRDIGRHAHGDARTTVDQQVGEAGGQDLGLGQGLVVVGTPINRVLLQVAQQLHGGFCQAALGVTHGRRGVAVDVAEVAMAIDERSAHGEPLGQADHGFVHRGVTMRMVLTDNFADGPGGLLMRAVGEDAALVHRVQDAAVHRLEAVAHVRQGAGGDNRHRVFDEGLLHLLAELRDLQRAAVDVLAGALSTVDDAEALLELLIVVLLVVLGLGIGVVPRLLALLGTSQQALQVVGHARRLLRAQLLVIHIVSHVLSLLVVAETNDHRWSKRFSRCRRLGRKRRARALRAAPDG